MTDGQGAGAIGLTVPPDCLCVFLDDTGHELLAPGHDYYGLGGCAVIAEDMNRLIDAPWRAVRKIVARDENAPLRAAGFSRLHTKEHLDAVATFFRKRPFMRVAAGATRVSSFPPEYPIMRAVLDSMKQRILDVAKWTQFRSIAVIFEASDRANHLVETHFGNFGIEENGAKIPLELCFMPKSSRQPALEVADFIANGIRQLLLRRMRGDDSVPTDFATIFHGIDRRLVSFMGIESAVIGPTAAPTAPAA